MKYLFLVSVLLVGSFEIAFAAARTNYTTEFKNPIKDSRMRFDSCAIEGALYGVLTNKIKDIVCFAKLKTEPAKRYVIYKAEQRVTYDYYEVLSESTRRFAGEQEVGVSESSVRLRQVRQNLGPHTNTRTSTVKITTSWIYSDINTRLNGKLPGKDEKFNAPLFDLNLINQELRDFADELDN